jgi:acetyl esterase/lipase
MPLDPYAKRFLDMVAVGGLPDASQLSPAAMRQAMLQLAQAVDAKNVPIGRVENRGIPGPGGQISIRVYTPLQMDDGITAGLIYFHGGAGVFCNLDTHEGFCRILANESACRIISVDYRLAPEHQFPAAIDDSYFASKWVFDNAAELGLDRSRIAVGGDSAGGTLATVVCQTAKRLESPKLALQVLFCPVTDATGDTQSRRALASGYFLETRTIDWALKYYCAASVDLKDPRMSPLYASDVTGLPKAHVHTAEYDPLRDEGKAYAELLQRSGVDVEYTCHQGMIHHFYAMAGAIPYARTAIGAAGMAIKKALRPETSLCL